MVFFHIVLIVGVKLQPLRDVTRNGHVILSLVLSPVRLGKRA
jgi:hypothetical protein